MIEEAADFRVRATRLPPAFDLLVACADAGGGAFLFERDGLGVAASTLAGGSRLGVEPASEAAIAGLGRSAVRRMRDLGVELDVPGPVAVGQFPFDDGGHAWMHIPSRLVRRTEPGQTWLFEGLLRVGGEGDDEGTDEGAFTPRRPAGGVPREAFSPEQVRQEPSTEAYAEMVRSAVARIHDGELRKVVLARTVRVAAARSLDPVRLAQRLRAVDPDAYAFITSVDHVGPVLVGASPELLVARAGRRVRSTPLAGSAPRSGDPERDRANAEGLLASAKNRLEHAIVVEAIADTLGPLCERLDRDREPELLETANVWHLATRFDGVLRDPAPTVVELVAALHPTPAVCGTPTDLARAIIGELEPFDRGGYAGPVGWMDVNGDGEWAIALRCAELRGDRATLFAGAGIVEGSEPHEEVEETDRKFRAFLDSLRWG